MDDIWAAFPSGNSEAAAICVKAWQDAGYKVAVLIDDEQADVPCDLLYQTDSYGGTAASFKILVNEMLGEGARLMALINDDFFPTFNASAENVANRYACHFPDGCGALQPTGDWYAALSWCCPSPVVDAEFAKRFNGGMGVFWPEYYHLYCDQEFRDVTRRIGCLVETDMIGFEHRHRTRGHADQLPAEKRQKIVARHDADKALFLSRQAAGFPGATL